MNYETLVAELATDPVGMGYAAMTDTEAAAAIAAALLATAAQVQAVDDAISELDWTARAILSGTVDTVESNSDFTISGDFGSIDNMYRQCWLVFTDGPNKGIGRLIGEYTGETKRVQFTGAKARGEFPADVTVGDSFYIVPTSDLVAGVIGVKVS